MKLPLLLGIALFAIPCMAGEIVATVNDAPISSFDAEARAKLISIQNSSPITKEKKKEYIKAALEALINDKVKITEAEKNGFYVSEKEIQDAIHHLEMQNGIKKGEMENMLSKNKIPFHILQEQIKADLMWLQVIQKNKKTLKEPSQTEIDELKNSIKKDLRSEGFYVAEILIKDEKTAQECYQQLHQGKSFKELAKKYSVAPSVKDDGELGWIKPNHYAKEVMEMLKSMGPGDLSVPLKTKDGYLIIYMVDRKYAILTDTIPIWELAQMALDANKTSAFGDQIKKLNSCNEFLSFGKEQGIKESVKSGMVSPQQLPNELKDILKQAKTKQIIGPIQTPDSDLFFMKCSVTNKKVLPSDEELKMRLEATAMEELSTKLLKNAKRFIVIEKKK